jgi:hypothetical protein
MASLFKGGQKPPQKVLEIIVGHMHRVAYPVYVGIVSLEINWSLARTQEMFDLLEEQGVVRPLTQEEKKAQHFPSVANVYVLTERPTPSKARW